MRGANVVLDVDSAGFEEKLSGAIDRLAEVGTAIRRGRPRRVPPPVPQFARPWQRTEETCGACGPHGERCTRGKGHDGVLHEEAKPSEIAEVTGIVESVFFRA